jgi:hypothetical protein
MDAYRAGILHRDFSVGNIIIDPDGKGWLIDWDLSKPVELRSETPRRATRTVRANVPPRTMNKANSESVFQGTWQFMSAGLVSGIYVQHDFKDDLESSVYVLLWVTLMYSEVSQSDEVPMFLSEVLDPRPYGRCGGHGKESFLMNRVFLNHVTFPHRPMLHALIDQVARLFAVRYEKKPTEAEREESNALLAILKTTPNDSPSWNVYKKSKVPAYDNRMSDLETHEPTIALFDNALRDRSAWPANDSAVKQIFGRKQSSQPTIKTNWSTTLCMEGLNIKSDGESGGEDEHEYQLIETSWQRPLKSSDESSLLQLPLPQ